ncbi:MAG: glycoside hydrolase family 27 protein [Oscillospiraceae bacterium]|nr:glycoside hydrolase family 27 protein [Oscillospiraceae bacterium]
MKITQTAPMGWNSWDCYGAAVDEKTVRANAEFCAEHLKEYGWEYIVVDIQWYEPTAQNHEYHPFTELCMDSCSRLIPAENRFPSSAGGKGFAPLADYIHSLGLKFGIHIMRGIPRQAVHKDTPVIGTDMTARQIAKTASICMWNTDMYGVDPAKEGAYEYYRSIFDLYASWGVDFIKCDDIARELPECTEELKLISRAMDDCGRDMVFSLSPGPAKLEYSELYKQCANMWRITDDFWDKWELLYNMFERAEKWSIHTHAGSFPDADMLPIGPLRQDYDKADRTKFTRDEQITMMTLWSIFRSPLFIGGEMTGFDDFTMSLVTNRAILDMHSDARHSHQARRFCCDGCEIIVWTAACAKGGTYLAVFNAGDQSVYTKTKLEWAEIYGRCYVTELWSGEFSCADTFIASDIPAHGAKAYLITDTDI